MLHHQPVYVPTQTEVATQAIVPLLGWNHSSKRIHRFLSSKNIYYIELRFDPKFVYIQSHDAIEENLGFVRLVEHFLTTNFNEKSFWEIE